MNSAKSSIIQLFVLVGFSLVSPLSKAQNNNYLYRADNGKTIIAGPEAQTGGYYTLDSISYLVVNDSLLRELAKERKDLSKTVTTRVTDMSFLLFKWTDFNQDISHWDVGQVTDFSWMFGHLELFNGDISQWNLSSAKTLSDMFHGTLSFQGDLTNWDVSNATMFNGMFHNSQYNQPINNWDLSNAINTSGMFDDNIFFNQPLDQWDVSRVEMMGGMFAEAVAFNQDISKWNTCNARDMTNMFRNANSFTTDLSGWCVPLMEQRPENFATKDSFKEPNWGYNKANPTPYRDIAIGVIGITGIGAVVWMIRKRKHKLTEISVAQSLIEKARSLGRQDLSREELDEVFGIADKAFEAQKVYRSRMLKELETKHPGLLRRERDTKDKRSYRYFIHLVDLSNK